MLKNGLYEQVINKSINEQIESSTDKLTQTAKIDNAEAPKILSKYIAEVLEKGLKQIKCNDNSEQLALCNKIVSEIMQVTGDDEIDGLSIDEKAEELLAVINRHNNISAINDAKKLEILRPETSIAMSSLFTGAVHEPSMMTELKKEIVSADRIDMLVSFIKWSGLRLIINELEEFTLNGGKLRVITTSYMGATDVKAIEELHNLSNTEIKISYDTKRTRLHAKSYVFYRETGFTTAYVGSSNLSNAAISSGLEWNVKITAKDLPDTINKITATFDSYWNSSEFSVYSESENDKDHLQQALNNEKFKAENDDTPYHFDIYPYPYQQEILDKLQAERVVRNHWRNLVVAATGTGKTVISAFDYKNFKNQNKGKPCRLLFVAHREEILKQSVKCFRSILRDANFGELYVGGCVPQSLDNLFISVQTLNSKSLVENTSADFYDYIIVDEFHHAAAPTYQKLLEYYKPKVLLGLTATPERMDGKDIFKYFDNRVAAEIRLPEAIDRKLLCPFQYFGVSDEVDYSNLKWSRGGYEKNALSNVLTGNEIRTSMLIKNLYKYVTDINAVSGLGFCVSKDHAEYMASRFNAVGISSLYLTSDSNKEERNSANTRLANGEIKFIFTVDLYNEGVDIPKINTILFLRPTESLTVFLQQLGRGLRLSDGKECLTVLDFIGQAHKKYNFEDKFSALLSNTNKSVKKEIKDGFISLPKGCYVQLEKQAQKYILDNINNSFGNKTAIINRISTFEDDTGITLTLSNFLDHYNLGYSAIYGTKLSFARLCVLAKAKADFDEPLEEIVSKSLARICDIDSHRWIKFILDYLPKIDERTISDFTPLQIRMLQMLQFTIWQKSYEDCGFTDLLDGFRQLKKCDNLLKEILDVLNRNYDRIDFIDKPVNVGFECPLDLHCTYTRDQILIAMDFMKPSTVREGVKYLADKKSDVLFITLNKSDKEYSPTTMYNDYSISSSLFHWQSQNNTSPENTTGKRYIHHRQTENKILLFVREFKTGRLGACPYTFLGLADFVSNEGSKPMNIVWKLQDEIPAKYMKKTNKLVAL